MKKYIVLISVLILASCGSKKVVLGNELFAFKSLGNDVADVNLTFYDNGTFELKALLLPIPESAGKTEKISEKGNFIEDGEWLLLKFDEDFNVNDFFDAQSNLKIIDNHKLQLNKNAKNIMLLGVLSENSKYLN